MIPILYKRTDTDYTTEGLGRLGETLSCRCTVNLTTTQYELELEYPTDGALQKELKLGAQVLAVPFEGERPQPFDVAGISTGFKGRKVVHCRHIGYRLSGWTCKPFSASNAFDAMDRIQALEGDCGFIFYCESAQPTKGDYELTAPKSIRAVLLDIVKEYGGSLWFDGNKVVLRQGTLDLRTDLGYTLANEDGKVLADQNGAPLIWETRQATGEYFGLDLGTIVSEGKNMTDLKREADNTEQYTRVLAWYKGTAEDGSDVFHSGVSLIQLDSAPELYQKTKSVDMTKEAEALGIPITDGVMESLATDYIIAHMRELRGTESLQVSFTAAELQGARMESIRPMDIVTVIADSLPQPVEETVTQTVYDVLAEQYVSVSLGDTLPSLGTVLIKSAEGVSTDTEKAISDLQDTVSDLQDTVTEQAEAGPYTLNVGQVPGSSGTGYYYGVYDVGAAPADYQKALDAGREVEFVGYIGIMESLGTTNYAFRFRLTNSGYVSGSSANSWGLTFTDQSDSNYEMKLSGRQYRSGNMELTLRLSGGSIDGTSSDSRHWIGAAAEYAKLTPKSGIVYLILEGL